MTGALAALGTRTFASLRKHRNYRLYFAGQIVSLTGTWMQDTALPWLVVQRTHSPLAVGLLLFCRFTPFALFGLFAGVAADRFDNRRVLMLTQAASMTVAAALAVLTFAGTTPLAVIYALAFLGGVALAFDLPNRQALTIQLVGRDELPNAVALNMSVFNAARIVGPAVAGMVIAIVGIGACFAANAASFLAVLIVLVAMRPAELFPLDRGETPPQGLQAIGEGINFVRNDPTLRLIIAMTALAAFTGFTFRVFLPLLASATLSAGAGVFGALLGCFGAGALAGGLYAAAAPQPGWGRLLTGSAGLSATMIALAPWHSLWAALVLLVVLGFCLTLWLSTGQSLLQLETPDRLRGRVLSLYILVLLGLSPLGNLLAAWLTAVGGTQLALVSAGVTGLLATAATARRVRGREAVVPVRAPCPAEAELRPVQLTGLSGGRP